VVREQNDTNYLGADEEPIDERLQLRAHDAQGGSTTK